MERGDFNSCNDNSKPRDGENEETSNYSEDEFDAEADCAGDDVSETESFIRYTAPIGPNIVISKHAHAQPTSKGQKHRFVKRTSTFMSTSKVEVEQSDIGVVSPTVEHVHSDNQAPSTSSEIANDKTKEWSLSREFRRLHLRSVVLPDNKRKKKAVVALPIAQKSKSNCSLFSSIVGSKETKIQQRLNSAKRLQIQDLKNKTNFLENRVQELTAENRSWKTLNLRQEAALRKYEGKDADLPKMIQHHQNEVSTLQHCLRKAHSHARQYEEQIRLLTHRVYSLQSEKEKLSALVKRNNLEERNLLEAKLKEARTKLEEVEHKLSESMRRFELIEKNHVHHIHVEHGKLRVTTKKLFDAEKEIDRLVDLVKQKDRLLNYLRIRTCRDPNLEPPGLQKILDVEVSNYKHFCNVPENIDQDRVESPGKSYAQDGRGERKLESRNKTIESIHQAYDQIMNPEQANLAGNISQVEFENDQTNLKLITLDQNDGYGQEYCELILPEPEYEQEGVSMSTFSSRSYLSGLFLSEIDNEINSTPTDLETLPDEEQHHVCHIHHDHDEEQEATVSKLRSLYLDRMTEEGTQTQCNDKGFLEEVAPLEPEIHYHHRQQNSAPPIMTHVGDIPIEGQLFETDNMADKTTTIYTNVDSRLSLPSLEGGGDTY